MELSTEKSTITINSTSDTGAGFCMNGQKPETCPKYLRAICTRMAPAQQKTAAGSPVTFILL